MFTEEPWTLSRVTAFCHTPNCRVTSQQARTSLSPPFPGLCQDLPLWAFQAEPSSVPRDPLLTRHLGCTSSIRTPLSVLGACSTCGRPISFGLVSPTGLADSLSPHTSQPLSKLPVELRTLHKNRKVRRSRHLTCHTATCEFLCTGCVAGGNPVCAGWWGG